MTDGTSASTEPARHAGLRKRFPGYFMPREAELGEFIKHGLIALDTNALFDLYRFNRSAREEYFHALQILGNRLWIPHRVGEEFMRRRLTVVKECTTATSSLSQDLKQSFTQIENKLKEFGNRRGLTPEEIGSLSTIPQGALTQLTARLDDLFKFELSIDSAIQEDEILQQVESLVADKVGPELEDEDRCRADFLQRVKDTVPPGYADHKKDTKKAVGDYLLWVQLMREAKVRALPVLLVTNEQKEDWIHEDQGKKLGPRPELVAEMLKEANVPFYLVNVGSFLFHAGKYIGANVSKSTVQQAEQLDEARSSRRSHIEAPSMLRVLLGEGGKVDSANAAEILLKIDADRETYGAELRDRYERLHEEKEELFRTMLSKGINSKEQVHDLAKLLSERREIWDELRAFEDGGRIYGHPRGFDWLIKLYRPSTD